MREEYFGLGFHFFDRVDLEAIHDATLEVMADVGVNVYGKEAHEILTGAGCTITDGNSLHFPKNLVNDAIASSPASYLMAGREEKFDAYQKPGKVTYTNFGTGIHIEDPFTGELRNTTKADLALAAKVCDAIDEVDQFTIAIAALDVPEASKGLHEAEAVFNNTSKHFGHDLDNGRDAAYFIRMAELVAGGKEALKERPICSMGTCPISPLELHQDSTELIITACRAGIPIDILSMAMTGGTSPVTIPGTMVVTNAEILAGIVLGQLVHKGNPMMYGTSTTMMDMKHMVSPVGAPEHAMFGAAVAELGQFYQIPTDAGGT